MAADGSQVRKALIPTEPKWKSILNILFYFGTDLAQWRTSSFLRKQNWTSQVSPTLENKMHAAAEMTHPDFLAP